MAASLRYAYGKQYLQGTAALLVLLGRCYNCAQAALLPGVLCESTITTGDNTAFWKHVSCKLVQCPADS